MSSIFQKPPFGYLYQVGINNLVNYRFDAVNRTAPQTNGVLHDNIVVPGNTIVQAGQLLDVRAFGNAGAHGASTLTFDVTLNGAQIFIGTSAANASGHSWEMWLRFLAINIPNNQAVLFGKYYTNGNQAGSTAVTIVTQDARNFLSPFGGVGFGFGADNTFIFRCSDAGGTEVITQEFTYVTIQ